MPTVQKPWTLFYVMGCCSNTYGSPIPGSSQLSKLGDCEWGECTNSLVSGHPCYCLFLCIPSFSARTDLKWFHKWFGEERVHELALSLAASTIVVWDLSTTSSYACSQ